MQAFLIERRLIRQNNIIDVNFFNKFGTKKSPFNFYHGHVFMYYIHEFVIKFNLVYP